MILQQLREQTHEKHRRLEARLDLLHITLSIERYRRLLARFYGYYVPIEARLEILCEQYMPELQFPQRCKVGLLVQDLNALGLTEQQVRELPLCANLPALDVFPQALGCMYVLEGATLGGQIISRHLESVHGISSKNGCAFFRSYGSEVGAMWRAYSAALTAYSAVHAEDASVIQSACETFATLENWLCLINIDE